MKGRMEDKEVCLAIEKLLEDREDCCRKIGLLEGIKFHLMSEI
jgi:hypothetical protein